MKRAIATLCTFALASFGALADVTASDPQQQPQQRQRGPIRVQTDLVSILASVTDAKGEPVIGLDQSAFQLTEEGIAQKIVRFEPQTNRPLDLALMLDASGSTAIELKIERDAAIHFVEEVVRPGDRLAVFSFAADVVQLSNFSDDLKQLDAAVRRVDTSVDMGTSLYDAVVLEIGRASCRERV
jgi:VWFA-related protein